MKLQVPWGHRTPGSRRRSGALPVYLVLLAMMWVVTGCVISPIEAQDGTVTPSPVVTIAVAPVVGAPGEDVFVSGAGWASGEVVYLNLEREPDGETVQTTVAIVTTDEDGRFTVSFAYPIDPVWSEAGEVRVVARSVVSGAQTGAVFEVMDMPSPPATVVPTVAPTAVPAGQPTPVPTATRRSNIGVVVSAALNVRSGPSTIFPILRTLSRGAEFTVLGQNQSGAWLLVRLRDGLEGWLARAYTDYTGTAPVAPSPKPPVVTVTPTPTQPPHVIGWRGEYFANPTLSGTPRFVRDDAVVDFDWGYGSPGPGIPNDHFSVRWTRAFFLPGGTYRFYGLVDDGVRVWVNGELLINEWRDATGRTYAANKVLAGGTQTIRVEFYEAAQIAKVRVWWEMVGDYPEWRGEYYPNIDFRGAPAFVRNDAAIDFDWGRGAPASNFPADRFSVRWTRDVYFDGGTYRFRATMDDGMRVFLDDSLILDAWQDGSARTVTNDVTVGQGVRRLRVEYYENTSYAVARFSWERISDPTPEHFPDWKGEYWDNRSLDGNPRVVRNDRTLDFNWGTGSPDSRIPGDNFSARWTRHVELSRGTYRFYALADDGVRVWVGDTRLINEWRDSRGDVTYSGDIFLDGRHRVKVEYYERTGGARVKVWWERIDTPPATVTPTPDQVYPYVDVVPGRGGAGTAVTAMGGGFPANTRVNLYLGGIARMDALAAASGQVYATTITDRRGNFSMSFAMPAAWPDGPPISTGRLALLVATEDFSAEAAAVFDYTAATATPPAPSQPSAVLSPRSGGAGTRVTVSGGGFPANTVLHVYLSGLVRATTAPMTPESVATVTSDGSGNYSVAFNMPTTWPGGGAVPTGKVLVIVATSDFERQTAAQFDFFVNAVNPSIEIVPDAVSAGVQVLISGGGFPANSTVRLYLAPLGTEVGRGSEQIYAATTTDRFGNYNLAFAMPTNWPDGGIIPSGRIAVVVANVDFSVTVGGSIGYTAAGPEPTATPPPAAPNTPVPAPYGSIAPGSGGAGTVVTISGGGFPGNVSVSAYLGRFDGGGGYVEDAQRYATAATNGSGDFSLTFAMPETWPDGSPIETGRVLVAAATDDFGTLVTVTFRYSAVVASERGGVPVVLEEATPEPPTATPLPTAEPTAVPSTATPLPTAEPTAVPSTATPLPTVEPTVESTSEPPIEEPAPPPTETPEEDGEIGSPGDVKPSPPAETE